MSGTPSCAISTAWACRSWCGAKRRRTPAAAAAWRSSARAAAVDQRRPRVGPMMTQKSGPTGSSTRAVSHGCSCSHAQSSMPTSRRRPPLPRRTSTEPRRGSRSASPRARASLIRNPARQRTTIKPRRRRPWRLSPATRIAATISSTVGGSAGYRMPLLRGERPAWKFGIVAGERRRPAASSRGSDMVPPSGHGSRRRACSSHQGKASAIPRCGGSPPLSTPSGGQRSAAVAIEPASSQQRILRRSAPARAAADRAKR